MAVAARPRTKRPYQLAALAARKIIAKPGTRRTRRTRASVPVDCVRRQQIGKGVVGTVYKTCCGGRCSYATKVFKSSRAYQNSEREIRLQNAVARAGLAPRIFTSGCSTKGGCAIMMERVAGTLDQYVQRRRALTEQQQRDVIRLLEAVARLGVDHGDVHSGNVAVDAPFKLRLIDFSEAKMAPVAVWTQVAKLLADMHVRFPALRFPVLEAYVAAARGSGRAAKDPCAEEESFIRLVAAQTRLRVDNPDVRDDILDIWMDGAPDCTAMLRKVQRRLGGR